MIGPLSQADAIWWSKLPRTSFGSPGMEERLAALIIAGRKRATVWNGTAANETAPGLQWVVTVADRPVCVIETLQVERRRFDQINASFAFEEGEGDRTLDFWRIVHEDYFRNEGHFVPEMELWCEQFRLIAIIDTQLAYAAAEHVRLEQAEGEALSQERARALNPDR
jgi:uncharacterized protein YhfF